MKKQNKKKKKKKKKNHFNMLSVENFTLHAKC